MINMNRFFNITLYSCNHRGI